MLTCNCTSKAYVSVPADPGGSVIPQSETTRRRFLKLMIGALSALVTMALAVPFVGTIMGPSFRTKKLKWVKVGDISSLVLARPANLKFSYKIEDAYIRETVTHSVWVIKHSSSEITVLSPICPHLGCHYDWHPEQKEFICPCHGSVFSIDGKVLSGPAPRPLDTFPGKIEDGILYVQWQEFRVGIPEKIGV
jgi:quinol---cytochrome c reductase iron-sulfur subunit, bacillus type